MNYGIIVRVLGNIIMLEAASMSLPLLISIIYKQKDTMAFAVCIALTGILGFAMSNLPSRSDTIKIREGVVIVSLGWFLISVFGSIPFVFSGAVDSFVDAFFETVSGFTTTGATVINNVEALPKGLLFWRSFTHWIGGMGILVFTVAFLPAMGIGSFQLYKAESPGPTADRIVPRLRDMAKILYMIYISMTVLEIILLVLGGMSLFESALYTFGSVGTGGFSTRNASVAAYDSTYIHIVISVFLILSGVNFQLYYIMFKGRIKEALKDQELRFYIGVIAISVILIALDIHFSIYKNFGKSLRDSLFQVSSIITTTGYSTANYDNWPTFSKGILFILMFIGGCAGSTAGGMKSIRILVLIKMIKREIMKIFHPRAVVPVKLGHKVLPNDLLISISTFSILYIFIFVLGTLIVSLEGIDLVSASSAVAATLGNIGIGLGLVGPAQNFSQFSEPIKFLFSFLMLIGRLEIFTVLALFSQKFWKNEF
ncbi:MAG TPA: TrkH family potassium uptake protein [Clostridiaceae bacterium]|nr:TrkH family potassium uptake protein [Clostridiaceae bacterium]